jgi:exosortase A-associated hydrolase 1
MSGNHETPLAFPCGGERLIGILHSPERPATRAVLVVVGAPQYRVGSHRQFVLLARRLAAEGFPVLRFDYRGMGDSEGDFAGFEDVGEDIKAAIDCLFAKVEGLRDVVLWGLCDGASAAAFYGAGDPRVSGLVLLNPWVRNQATLARARSKGYYGARLASRDFWRKLARGELDLAGSARDLVRALIARFRPEAASSEPDSLPGRVAASLRGLGKPVLLILSGADLTAREFDATVLESRAMGPWRRDRRVAIERLDHANHTYATSAWRNQVHDWTLDWLRAL